MSAVDPLATEVAELRTRLAAADNALREAEETNRALLSGQVDAVVDSSGTRALLLHQAQEALRQSEERYRTMVTTSDEGIWTVDTDMVITFVNERLASLAGYAVDEMVGRKADEFISTAAREPTREIFAKQREGQRERRDIPFRRKDGTLLWVSIAASPIFDGEGRYAGSLGMATDVTSQRALEEERRRAEELFRTIFRANPAAIGIGAGGVIIEVNDKLCEFFGYPREELVGARTLDLGLWAEPNDRERMYALLKSEGSVRDLEATFVRKDGVKRDALITVESLQLREGEAPLVLIMVIDVTERKAHEQAVRESEERYRALFDENPMPMWAYDPKTLEIVTANEAAATQYGYTTTELASLTLLDIRPPEDAEKIRALINSIPLGRSHPGVWKHLRKDGSTLDVDVHLNHVALGGRALILAVLHDVTQRRNLEDQLRQSQKMESVGRLAGGVAHDFNNLLTAILGYSELLEVRFKANDPAREELGEIRRAGERAAALTRQLLAFSRKQVLVPEILDLGGVVRGLVGLLDRLIGEHIQVSVVVAPDLGRVAADPGQMEQVLLNLAVNARDAMPNGGKLRFELTNVDFDGSFVAGHAGVRPGSYVLLAVTDTGDGMTAEVQKKIFEPFFTTKEIGKGTGLGLSTVHGIVNQSGGSIWVYSEPGRGTTFKIYLPRVAAPGELLPKAADAVGTSPGTGTILVVEDEAQLRRLAKRILEKSGYKVLEASESGEAQRVAVDHSGPIDLLLTDVVMPGLSGPDLAAALRASHPLMRVLFMSGYTDNAIVDHGILRRGTHFLQKPFTPNRLTERVREVLESALPS